MNKHGAAKPIQLLIGLLTLLLCFAISGCGGGGNNTDTPEPSTPETAGTDTTTEEESDTSMLGDDSSDDTDSITLEDDTSTKVGALLGTWKGLAFYEYGKNRIEYPYDGSNPVGHIWVVNESLNDSPDGVMPTTLSAAVVGEKLNTFPNFSKIMVLKPGETTLVTNWFQELFQMPVTAFSDGETRSIDVIYRFEFEGDETYEVTRSYEIYYAGKNPIPSGKNTVKGKIVFKEGAEKGAVSLQIGTMNWKGTGVDLVVEGDQYTFQTTIPDTNYWYLHVGGAIKPMTYKIDRAQSDDITLSVETDTNVAPTYQAMTTVSTSTGFWRGAVSESEQTAVFFPGQENWNSAQASTLKANAKIYKYGFDGNKIWEYSPGWEVWGGDMSRDGAYVAYALYTGTFGNVTPPDFKLELLNGNDGSVLWTKTGDQLYESYEIAISDNNQYIAVGSVGRGTVTFFNLQNGEVVRTLPASDDPDVGHGWGQIRKLRFYGNDEFLYVGSGDGGLRKVRVSDGSVVWRTSVGGWPFVNGLDISMDGNYLAVGMKSAMVAYVRASDGNVMWTHDTGNFDDAFLSPDGLYLSTLSGHVYETATGSLVGQQTIAPGMFTSDSQYVCRMPGSLDIFPLAGAHSAVAKSGADITIGRAAGEQPQWMHLSDNDEYGIVAARDMANPPQTGIVFYKRQ